MIAGRLARPRFFGKREAPRLRPSLLRRLDYVPAGPAMALGMASGALLGGGLLMATPLAAGAGFVVLLGLAVRLARSGEPITVIEPATPPQAPEPAPVPPQPSRDVAMASIPGGVFSMGSADAEQGRSADEGPVHAVRVSAFECMRHPVTRRLYQEVTGNDPGWPAGEADERPVNQVSWYDAVDFCNRLSLRAGLTPCYHIDANRQVAWNSAADGFRLLTEAEWEYACRAGSSTRYSFGDDERELERHAWYAQNAGDSPHPVGRKEPNRWGLYDMHGNVWEWCWDCYAPYSAAAQDNPTGPSGGKERVLRGGAFHYWAENLRSADRNLGWPEYRSDGIGFRCARGPRRQP